MTQIARSSNLIVTYGSQLYMAAVGIVMLPFYVALLGVERYGIVALAVALQSWLALLDMGLSSTLTRQAANTRAGASDAASLRALVRLVERLFLLIGLSLALAALLGAELIARQWLQAQSLAVGEIIYAIRLIGLTLMFRFLCVPWRALLTGYEDFGTLAAINIVITTLRSVGVLVALAVFEPSLEVFFEWQLSIGVVEFVALLLRGRCLLPAAETLQSARTVLREHWRFSLSLASAAMIWVGISNADKVILSGLLPLSDYAIFSVATVAANGVALLVGPFAVALGPGLMRAHAKGDRDGLVALYDRYSQLVATFAIAASLMLALFPYQVIWAWTGKADVAQLAAPVLRFYALGNCALAIGALPLQLQVAAGQMRWHIAGSIGFGIIFLPLLLVATRAGGTVGAGAAWLAINVVFTGVWLPFLHHRFYPGKHWSWFSRNVLAVLFPTTLAGAAMAMFLPWPDGRISTLVQVAATGAVLLGVAIISSAQTRRDFGVSIRSS